MTNFSFSTQQFRNAPSSLIAFLVEPSHVINDIEQRRQAQFVTVGMLLSIVGMFGAALFFPELVLAGAILSVPTYFLSRSRFYKQARWLSFLVALLPSLTSIIQAFIPGTTQSILTHLPWLVTALIYFSLASSIRFTTVTAVLLSVGLIVLMAVFVLV